MLDKLQKRLCRTVSTSLVWFSRSSDLKYNQLKSYLKVLLCLMFIWIGRTRSCSLFLWQGHSLHYSNRLYDFSVTVPRCYKECLCQQFLSLLSWTVEVFACKMLSFNLWSRLNTTGELSYKLFIFFLFFWF